MRSTFILFMNDPNSNSFLDIINCMNYSFLPYYHPWYLVFGCVIFGMCI